MAGPHQQQQQQGQQQRSVSFAEDRNETFEFDNEYDASEKHNLFYAAGDFTIIKGRMRREASRMKREGFGNLLEECFDPKSRRAQDLLNAYAQLPDENCGRGLERYLSRRFSQDRTEIKDFCLFTVLTKQRKLRRTAAPMGTASWYDTMSESIAADYREQSLQARLFARRIAIADELVVLGGDDATTAQRLVSYNHSSRNKRHHSSSSLSSDSESSSSSDNDSLSLACQGPVAKIPRCPSSPVTPVEEFAQMAMEVDTE